MRNRLVESDVFPFELISKIAERESWRKDINRPIYHLHKWWAKRLGSVFRAILLGCVLPEDSDLLKEFYSSHELNEIVVLDPFMGSGTTIGEALKLGMTVFGKDINPVAAESVRVSLTPIDFKKAIDELESLKARIGERILSEYKTNDSSGAVADVLYYFWIMQGTCMTCQNKVDLFSNYILAQDAYPLKKPKIQVVCPCCAEIIPESYHNTEASCPQCGNIFNFRKGSVERKEFVCSNCNTKNKLSNGKKPSYRLYAKLVLTKDQKKEYLKATTEDINKFNRCSETLRELTENHSIVLPDLALEQGHNTQQAISYGFRNWKDFFNDRQLLLLAMLYREIDRIPDQDMRDLFTMIFSSTLEFNNLFVSYKGEGTGAVRHMFSHHILKPERTPIEPNIWGTAKSSGSFTGIFKNKVKRIVEYRNNPKEVRLDGRHDASYRILNSEVKMWETEGVELDGSVNLACGDSSILTMSDKAVDFIVTDPPFFDNVHYSELADFFFAWLKLNPHGFIDETILTTRSYGEVQDSDEVLFSMKLEGVFKECHRVLKDSGLLIFTYHHSKPQGWTSIAKSISNAGFSVINSHPVKAEMSVATPKQQAKEPIQLDIILVCKKIISPSPQSSTVDNDQIINNARSKSIRLEQQGFKLSKNDLRIILYGELLKYKGVSFNVKEFECLFERF